MKRLPNFIIIGAMKGGTTSLHYYLGLHPEISMSRVKELNFFIREKNWDKGVEWYQSNFTGNGKICGEASPGYTNYPVWDGVPERITSVAPDVKLIYVLRDPIERIISHYHHYYLLRKENRSLSDALSDHSKSNTYISRSLYYMQIEQYTKYFRKSDMLIITSEELNSNRRLTLQKIFRFLGVDDTFWSVRFLSRWHRSAYKRRKTPLGLRLERSALIRLIRGLPFEIQGAVEKILYIPFSRRVRRPEADESLCGNFADLLKEDIRRLREYTGRDFKMWSI